MNGNGWFPTVRRPSRVLACVLALPMIGLIALGCSSGTAGARRVEAVISGDGSFDPTRVTRLVLAIDGDADTRLNTDVPLGAGFGNGVTFTYAVQGGTTLVLAAVALDAQGARVASGVADPVAVSTTMVPLVNITLSSSGRVDGGVPVDLRPPMRDL